MIQKQYIDETIKKLDNAMSAYTYCVDKTSGVPGSDADQETLYEYDTLFVRFLRTYEIFIKVFISVEIIKNGEKSDFLRDTLNNMEKLSIITHTNIWFDMRQQRNVIVHDYSAEVIYKDYQLVVGEYYKEMKKTLKKIHKLVDILNL